MAFALMAFAFMGSSSSNSSSGSPRTVIGKRPRASLVSALRQNRILALFATHVLRAGVALTPPLSASDRSGDSAAQNKCPLWARRDISRPYSCLRGTGHQYCENDRHEEERRHIRYQMATFTRITEGLYAHDRAVNHARPHGEPDKALVRVGILRCDEQKYPERRVQADNHQQIVGLCVTPRTARGRHKANAVQA